MVVIHSCESCEHCGGGHSGISVQQNETCPGSDRGFSAQARGVRGKEIPALLQ